MASYNSHFSPPNRPDAAPILQSSALSNRLRSKTSANLPPSRSNIPTSSSSSLPRSKTVRITNGAHNTDRPRELHPPNAPGESQPSARTAPDPASALRPKTPSNLSFGFGLGSASTNTTVGPRASPEKVKPQRNVLRRKPSSINQHTVFVHVSRMGSELSVGESNTSFTTSGSASIPDGFIDPFPGSILGITMPPTTSSIPNSSTAPRKRLEYGLGSIENLPSAMPQKPATHEFPPPTSGYNAHTSSPSTRYSESPGPWSRTSTPTSMSSHSPGISLPTNLISRVPHQSPTQSRPPLTRRRAGSCGEEGGGIVDAQGLPSVRESLNSSSSGSTVKGGDRGDEGKDTSVRRKKKKRLSPLPPSPPPRKSSQTFTRKKSLHNISEGSGATVSASLAAAPIPCPSSSQRAPNISSPPLGSTGEAPVRPSREGTPNLGAENSQEIHIVQSNLTNLASHQTTSHRRQGSFGISGSLPTARKGSFSTENPLPTNSLARSGGPSRIPSRNPSPSPSQQSSHRAIPSLSLKSPNESKDGKGHSPSKSTSRFGIFSRRPKPIPEPLPTEKPEKPGKKGPTAGTGYEGYGKYSARGRSGSTTSASGSWARSTSASSATGSNIRSTSSRKGSNASKNELEADGFFLDRLEPVFISGGGSTVESQRSGVNITGSGGSQDASGRRPSTESKNSSTQISVKSKASNELSRPNLAHLAVPSDPLPKPQLVKEPVKSTQGSDNENSATMPTLAARRSQNRPQPLSGMEPMSIPMPINTLIITPSPSAESTDATSQYSTPVLIPSDMPEDKDASRLKPKKEDKRAKSPRRWNFFQRTQTTTQRPPTVTEVPVTVARRPPPRQVAHYALLDGGYQDGNDDLGVIMNEIQESTHSERGPDYARSNPYTSELRRQEHVHSILLPDPPSLPPGLRNTRPSSPKVLLRPPPPIPPPREPEQPAEAPVKRSRLAQVGRIPRVVSTRDRQPPLQPFSRPPFARQDTDNSQAPSTAPQLNFDPAESARLIAWPDYTKEIGDFPVHDSTASVKAPTAAKPPTPEQTQIVRGDEFLAFSPRKMSEMSSSSSGMFSSAATTAVIPDPRSALGEDEVWDEYDDLIDNVLSPELRHPDKPFLGPSFEGSNQEAQPRALAKESPTIGSTTKAVNRLFPPKTFGHLSGPFGSPTRTSKISVMNSAVMPPTPMSFTDFFAGYGERNLSVIEPLSPGSSAFYKNRFSSGSLYSKSTSTPDLSVGGEAHDPDFQITDFAREESDDLGLQTNLRLAAMTTSKWLSFGRVLFSPAHIEVMQAATPPAGNRVLVLDGLGNDDWPYFCALTYPHATIYNLSPSPSSATASATKRGSGAIQTAENYRQIYHPDLDNPFPFPRGFFNAVVSRFPAINSEAAYRSAISESKRVLRPGGYLEISVLDLDMVNMGNRARRAVRMLKVKLHVEDDTLSLRPTSDTIQRMLGRRGFENLNRCMVGVPVAGRVADSRAGSLDEGRACCNNTGKDRSQGGDEGVTKMAPRVGRWWYTRCYESPLLPENGDMSRSIWNDRALLRECEKRKTSFKMLLCYAQKPLAPLRRTVSV